MHDLILRGGRVLDISRASDLAADDAFSAGLVSGIGGAVDRADGAEVRPIEGWFVVPGLIDLHTHVYWGGTSLGVDAGAVTRVSGTTTFVVYLAALLCRLHRRTVSGKRAMKTRFCGQMLSIFRVTKTKNKTAPPFSTGDTLSRC
jgi:predicted amidohydrolase YtcJ